MLAGLRHLLVGRRCRAWSCRPRPSPGPRERPGPAPPTRPSTSTWTWRFPFGVGGLATADRGRDGPEVECWIAGAPPNLWQRQAALIFHDCVAGDGRPAKGREVVWRQRAVEIVAAVRRRALGAEVQGPGGIGGT